MMDKSILALIDSAKELLTPDSTDYRQPVRAFLYCSFLAPTTFTGRFGELYHHFLPDTDVLNALRKVDESNTIIHGHTEDELCAAPHFCHLLGYRPDDTNSPAFRKVFQQKWNY